MSDAQLLSEFVGVRAFRFLCNFAFASEVNRVLDVALCAADALLSMASSWGRIFPTWMGSDPCVNWEGVACYAGLVVGL